MKRWGWIIKDKNLEHVHERAEIHSRPADPLEGDGDEGAHQAPVYGLQPAHRGHEEEGGGRDAGPEGQQSRDVYPAVRQVAKDGGAHHVGDTGDHEDQAGLGGRESVLSWVRRAVTIACLPARLERGGGGQGPPARPGHLLRQERDYCSSKHVEWHKYNCSSVL